uniref:Engulfment and cell motility protein 1 n=2 Tax=Hirondellea gigas TaxID=1518452 RepID=A0A6A7FUE6_9CRUS
MSRATSGMQQDIGLKVAVQHQNFDAFMGSYDPSNSLEEFIKKLCENWNLPEPSRYMLQFLKDPLFQFVSDENKHEIKQGAMMKLVTSAPLLCSSILATLTKSPPTDISGTVVKLNKFAHDPTFAKCFVEKQGLQILQTVVESMTQEDALLSQLLQAFTQLVSTARVDWEISDDCFISKVTVLVDGNMPVPEQLLYRCFILLELIVSLSSTKYIMVEKGVSLLRLMEHLKTCKDPETRRAILALVNSMFIRAKPDRKKDYLSKLSGRQYRNYITDYVLQNALSTDEHGAVVLHNQELCQQLHKLQQLLLNQLLPRLLTGAAPDDARVTEKILELRNVAFESDAEASGSSARHEEIKKKYKKLGFKNDNPAHDFNEVPPGLLALDNIYYFCHNRPEQYSKLVLENCYRADSHECPIGKASINLTKLLAQLLKIGEAPRDQCSEFHPMLFTNDHPFEELFCICITLLNKTWKEMKATTEDFSKVLSVVKEQISHALKLQPPNLDQFQKRLQLLTYKEITEIWQNERRSTEAKEMNAPQIQKLKDELRRDIDEVVQQQRLRILEEGARFRNPPKRSSRDKFFFCRLSPNHKLFHYDECDEKATKVPPLDDLTKKVSVSDIKSIATGKECPHHKSRKQQYAFSLMLESGKTEAVSLDFVAAEEELYNIWHDGVKVLLRETMVTEAAARDIEMLLNMEIKLQLLDVEGVTIPSDLPPVPPLPPNYNFCYNL